MAEYYSIMTTTAPDKNSSDFKSAAWTKQANAWQLTCDLWESPLYIREQREKYLEKFRKEKAEKYNERLNRSVFSNKFRETIETFAGMVFKADPSPKDAPKPIAELFTDIDGCGNSLHQFLLNAFEMFLRDGNAYIFVDAPPAPKLKEGQTPTGKDRENDRPFWILYTATQVINHRYETIGGREVLSQATIEEKTLAPDGEFGEKTVVRHRILRRGSYEVRVQNEKKEWIPDLDNPGGLTGLTEIPLVSIAEIGAVPMLLVLAMLNQQYYNKVSDFDSWCHMACVPRQVLKFDTIETAKEYLALTQSADTGLIIAGKDANAFYLEVKGSGLEIADQRNEQIKSEMAAIGVGLLAPSELAPKSATEVMDTAGQRQSKLARYAREFENAVEKAFYFTAEQWNVIRPNLVNLGEAEKSALKLTMDFDRLTFNAEQMGIFERLNTAGKLSDLTFFELLQNVIDFPQGWTPEVETKRLLSQQMDEIIVEPPPLEQ